MLYRISNPQTPLSCINIHLPRCPALELLTKPIDIWFKYKVCTTRGSVSLGVDACIDIYGYLGMSERMIKTLVIFMIS